VNIIYNIAVFKIKVLFFILKFFNSKIKLFLEERKNVFEILKKNISNSEKYIWIHVASLGEYEQGLPIFKEIKSLYHDHKIVVSFFSSSGYEVKKKDSIGDLTVYLPIDSYLNSKKFIDIINPKLAFFVKYEFWPNYLRNLKKNKVPTYLIAGNFREDQWFFKWYGNGFLLLLKTSFTHFFVQNNFSLNLLKKKRIFNSSVMGDSRFDRVKSLLDQNNSIENIKEFINTKTCIVAGSTWNEDEKLFIDFIKSSNKENICWIIAPHQIDLIKIKTFQKKLSSESILLSEMKKTNCKEFKILIIDCVGRLTKLYSYADISYVGGGMGNSGLHNILEPAIFKSPIIIGKNYKKFPEANEMIKQEGLISVKNSTEFKKTINTLIENKDLRLKMGEINYNFINKNLGATDKVISFLKQKK
jgi:3-deoxy-D-manno-octulosonic-acid transferase